MKALKYLVFGAVLLTASPAFADTILKFGLSETGPDLVYSNGVLETRDDGNLTTLGDQNTGLNFVGFLEGVFPDIFDGASASLDAVAAVGGAAEVNGVIVQQTQGGIFSLWDQNNVLLLQAELGEGAVTGSTDQSTGSFFNTGVVNFTGGSLLALVLPTPGGISFALAGITTAGQAGLDVVQSTLSDFSANASGLVTGESVPEPSSLALLFSSILGLRASRRKKALQS